MQCRRGPGRGKAQRNADPEAAVVGPVLRAVAAELVVLGEKPAALGGIDNGLRGHLLPRLVRPGDSAVGRIDDL